MDKLARMGILEVAMLAHEPELKSCGRHNKICTSLTPAQMIIPHSAMLICIVVCINHLAGSPAECVGSTIATQCHDSIKFPIRAICAAHLQGALASCDSAATQYSGTLGGADAKQGRRGLWFAADTVQCGRANYLSGCAFWCQVQAVRITVARSEWRGTKFSTFRAADTSATR